MTHRDDDSVVVTAIAVLLGVVGASSFNILPVLEQGATQTLSFSPLQIGVMSLAISVGSGASSLFAGMWVRTVQWPRAAAFWLCGLLVANVCAMFLKNYWPFVLMQAIAGVFGASALSLAWTILSDRQDSARGFGIACTVQVAYQVAGVMLGPTLLRIGGLNAVLAMLAVLSALVMCLVPLLPTHGRIVLSEVRRPVLAPATLIALLAYGTFFMNAGAYWTYIELIGLARGLSERVVADCIAGGLAAGLFGGVFAWAFGQRFGMLRPLGIAALLTVASALLLLKPTTGVNNFLVSNLLYYISLNSSVAYQLALINAVDATGRGVALSGAFGFLGQAGGAALATLFVTPTSYAAVLWVVALTAGMSTGLFILSLGMFTHTWKLWTLNRPPSTGCI